MCAAFSHGRRGGVPGDRPGGGFREAHFPARREGIAATEHERRRKISLCILNLRSRTRKPMPNRPPQKDLPRVLLLNRRRRASRHSYRVRLGNREGIAPQVRVLLRGPAGRSRARSPKCLPRPEAILYSSEVQRTCMPPGAVFPTDRCVLSIRWLKRRDAEWNCTGRLAGNY